MAEILPVLEKICGAIKSNSLQHNIGKAVYQFQFHENEDVYQLIFDEENPRVEEGEKEPPNCTMIFTLEDFEKMSKGSLNGTEAFMSGRLKIKGDKVLALKLQKAITSLKNTVSP